MLEFSRQCGARLHQSQRSEPTPDNLPQLQEIDHLMEKSRRQLDCYAKMREFIIAQQTAYFHQAQEQQSRAQEGVKRDSVHQNEESKAGGFAGAEAKKRRGVSIYSYQNVVERQLIHLHSALLLQADATAATEPRRPNGAEVQMALALCVMPVDFTMPS
jgi:hypothetical protein